MVINAYDPGGASLDAHAAPSPTEDTVSIKPASGAVETTAARPEVLEPRAKNMEWSKLQLPLPLPLLP